jgi:hypothetical protein
MAEEREDTFVVFAEVEGHEKPLVMTDLSLQELMIHIVNPYEKKKPFFIDGVAVTKDKINKIKILLQGRYFKHDIAFLRRRMTSGPEAQQKIYGDQYYTRYEDAIRQNCRDITSQVIEAYDKKIKPSIKTGDIKEYLHLIPTVASFLNETLKLLGIKV